MTNVVGLDDCTTKHVVSDSYYASPFVYITKVSSPTLISFFDCNTNSNLSDLNISVLKVPSRVFFDVPTSTVVFDDTDGNLIFYDVTDKTSETVSDYVDVPISSAIDISVGDKEIVVADKLNHRILVLDRFSHSLLRTFTSNFIRWPYRLLCLNDGGYMVRCFTNLNVSAIYRLSQNGEILETFPSQTPFTLSGGVPVTEDWYKSNRSSAAGMSAFSSDGYAGVLVVNEVDNTYEEIALAGYSISGLYVDDSSGDVFVNTLQGSTNRILRVRKGTGIVGNQKSPCQGMICGIDDLGVGFETFSEIENAKNSNFQNTDVAFSGVDNNSSPVKLSSSDISLSSQTSSYKKVGSEKIHVIDRSIDTDVWHFRYTGIAGSKVSIDRDLTFDYFDVENTIRVPVFCWDFEEDEYVDTFLISDGEYIRKMAFFYKKEKVYVEKVKEITEDNVVNSIYVFDGRFIVSAGGYLSSYSYEDMNKLDSYYFANDVIVSDCRFGYIWASSKSRGKIWKIDQYDLSSFEELSSEDAPCGLFWSEYFGKYIVHCDNSLKYMDYLTEEITTFYDVTEYVIEKILVINDEIAMLLKSHESIPVASDYEDLDIFEVAVRNRKSDKICLLAPNRNKYTLEKSLPYNWNTSDVTFDGETISYLSTDNLSVYIGFFDKVVGIETVYTYISTASPVGIVELPLAGMSVAVISDWSVLDWSSGKVLPIDSWGSSSSSSDVYGNASLISNGIIIKKSVIGKQFGSSSSSSSSSSQSGFQKTYSVRIMVGDSPGSSNRWDSGEFTTMETCVLYCGGNNLEPGQKYYVSIRSKGDLDVWSPYDVFGFIMPHFDNFSYKLVSSSSSSSNSVESIDTVYALGAGETVNCGFLEEVAIVFSGEPGQSGQIVLGTTTVTVENSGGDLLFAPGKTYEHEFTFIGETSVALIGAVYSITLVLDTELVFVVRMVIL